MAEPLYQILYMGLAKDDLEPDEIAEWEAAQVEIERLVKRIKLLRRRAQSRRERGPSKREIARLRVAMIAAHPDKGGSNEAFITANRRYRQAISQRK
jgi:hypothetical protein